MAFDGKVAFAVVAVGVIFAFAVERAAAFVAMERDALRVLVAKLLRAALLVADTTTFGVTTAVFCAITAKHAFAVIHTRLVKIPVVTAGQRT